MNNKNDNRLLLYRLVFMSLIISVMPVATMLLLDRNDYPAFYIVSVIYTMAVMSVGYHYYRNFTKRTARQLKSLVQKESLINGELVLINTEEKLKSILSLEIERCSNQMTESSILFFDVDDLGLINNKYGYDVGDQVIIELILLSKLLIEKGDQLARIKGDTFAVMFSGKDKNYAYDFASKLKKKVEEIPFQIEEKVTCRFVVIPIDRWLSEEKLLLLAYEKLKLAKDYGKGVIL